MHDHDSHRQKVLAEVSRRNLVSLSNDTRWKRLVRAVSEDLAFRPAYQRKDVLGAQAEPADFEGDVAYLGD